MATTVELTDEIYAIDLIGSTEADIVEEIYKVDVVDGGDVVVTVSEVVYDVEVGDQVLAVDVVDSVIYEITLEGGGGGGGTPGVGVPVGGTTGQRLAKASDTNYDTEWVDDCPPYKYAQATSAAEGLIDLKDNTNWNTSKAYLSTVMLETASTDWDLYLLQNDNGLIANDATIPAIPLMLRGSGDATIELSHAYEDEDDTQEVHFFFRDNAGSATCNLTAIGYSLN